MKNEQSNVFDENSNDKENGFSDLENTYKKITENINFVKWVLDVETMKFVYVSEITNSLRGFTIDEILKQDAKDSFNTPSDIFLKEILPQRQTNFIKTKERIFYTDEFEQPCKNGSTIWTEIIWFFHLNSNNKVEIVGTSRNINDRKIAEQKAIKEQNHRELFVKNAPLAIIEWDKNKNILAWNPASEKIFGYNETEALGKDIFDLIIPDYEGDGVSTIVEELLQNQNENYIVNNNTTKDGSTIICEWHNTTLTNQEGELISVVSIAKDITDFEKALEDKNKANKNYKQLINELHEGVGIVNLNEEFIFVNPAFEQIIGYNSDELIGKNLSEYIPKDEFINIITETEKRKQGESSKYIAYLLAKNGTKKAISLSGSPWRNEKGEIVGSMALIIDITNQISANEELKRRYDFEKRIFNISSRFGDHTNFNQKVNQSLTDIGILCNASSAFVVKLDHKNELGTYSHVWENQNNKSDQNFAPCAISIFSWLINQFYSKEHLFIKNIEDLNDEASLLKDYFIRNSIQNLMSFPIYMGEKLYGILGVQNILNQSTWSKNEFILLRSAGEILCNAIQRKLNEDQIKKLNTQLSNKNKEIEQVLYVTSHDIRSPLVNIIGFTKELNKSVDELNELLSKQTITDEDKTSINYLILEDIPEVLKYINAGGEKIDKLLNSLLKLSRLGRTNLDLSDINIRDIVNEIIESVEYQIQNFKIEIKIGNLPELVTDRNLMTQILTNLIDNAIKYHDENKQSYILIGSNIIDNEIIIQVEDNGIGIPDDKKENVFEIFSRINPEKTEGEGIGLTIIKRAVERLKGHISVESEFGAGSKFSIVLPVNIN